MTGTMEMRRRMLRRRRIATPHMPTHQAQPKMHPPATHRQAILTTIRRRLNRRNRINMRTRIAHTTTVPTTTFGERPDAWLD
jgi:hypothetical protein